jgi:hypothetical protein
VIRRIICAVAMFAVGGCGGSSAPSAPSNVAPRTTAPTFGSFGITIQPMAPTGSANDFARCLAGSDGARCFSASRFGARSVAGASAVGAPINLNATAIGSSVTLTWIAPSSGGVLISYIIEAGSTPGAANLANFSTNSTATSFSASGVGAGTYFVRVRALTTSEISAPSNEAVVVVTGADCAGIPGAPSGLSVALNSGGTVVLTWNAAAGNPTSYVIEAGSAPGLTNVANSDLGLTTTLTATGVGLGTYYVRIRARNACGIGPASGEITVVVLPTLPNYAGTWRGGFHVDDCTDIDPPGTTPILLCGRLERANSYELALSQAGSAVVGRYRPLTYLMSCPCGGDYGTYDMAGTIAADGVLPLSGTAAVRGWGLAAPMTFSLLSPSPSTLSGTVAGALVFGGVTRATFHGTIVSGSRQ